MPLLANKQPTGGVFKVRMVNVTGARSGTICFSDTPASMRSEFERRLQESQRVVYQIAYGILGNAADAEDVSQDVYLRAYRKLGDLRDPQQFCAWVARMSRRLALNHRRAAVRAQRRNNRWSEDTASLAVSAETEVAASVLDSRLGDEIQRLPDKLRGVLLLSAVDGLDTRAVSGILGIPPGTVRSRLHAARKELLRRFAR